MEPPMPLVLSAFVTLLFWVCGGWFLVAGLTPTVLMRKLPGLTTFVDLTLPVAWHDRFWSVYIGVGMVLLGGVNVIEPIRIPLTVWNGVVLLGIGVGASITTLYTTLRPYAHALQPAAHADRTRDTLRYLTRGIDVLQVILGVVGFARLLTAYQLALSWFMALAGALIVLQCWWFILNVYVLRVRHA